MKIRFTIKILSSNNTTSNIFKNIVIKSLSIKVLAKFLNNYYNKLNYKEKGIIHTLFAKTFRNNRNNISIKKWKLLFYNSEFFAPLRKSHMWLDWDSALSLTGHDIDIKSTYEYLLERLNLNCVFDVGANYCTHSILFLSNDIQTYSFEPNKKCFEYFNECLKLNNLKGNFINTAIGSELGKAELTFPENDTWLGTISAKENDYVNKFENLKTTTVSIDTLDNYSQLNNLIPDLLKIDTEGFEIEVLKGAEQILKENKPIIIFESNDNEKRVELFQHLNQFNYGIYNLIDNENKFLLLDDRQFEINRHNNFIAIPDNHFLLSKK